MEIIATVIFCTLTISWQLIGLKAKLFEGSQIHNENIRLTEKVTALVQENDSIRKHYEESQKDLKQCELDLIDMGRSEQGLRSALRALDDIIETQMEELADYRTEPTKIAELLKESNERLEVR